jgi:hypothetical protein
VKYRIVVHPCLTRKSGLGASPRDWLAVSSHYALTVSSKFQAHHFGHRRHELRQSSPNQSPITGQVDTGNSICESCISAGAISTRLVGRGHCRQARRLNLRQAALRYLKTGQLDSQRAISFGALVSLSGHMGTPRQGLDIAW